MCYVFIHFVYLFMESRNVSTFMFAGCNKLVGDDEILNLYFGASSGNGARATCLEAE